jgi:hypothetical protein
MEAQASTVDPPLTRMEMSNHWAMRIECPLIASELQMGEVVQGRAWMQR